MWWFNLTGPLLYRADQPGASSATPLPFRRQCHDRELFRLLADRRRGEKRVLLWLGECETGMRSRRASSWIVW
jgi:hypothetical protein